MNQLQINQEFDRQLNNLIKNDYPRLAKLSVGEFDDKVKPLRVKFDDFKLPEVDMKKGKLPFVLVVKGSIISSEKMMVGVKKNDIKGVTILRPLISDDFNLIDEITLPESDIYLLLDIDRGKESLNERPREAFKSIKKNNRFPLTIDEGIAVVTHFPDFLMKNNCFSLLGSRTGRDQRVPAIWINSKKEPNLGWCWDGNPHTWLGSASCMGRIGL